MLSFSAGSCLRSQRDAGTTIVTHVSDQISHNPEKSFYRRYDRTPQGDIEKNHVVTPVTAS